MESGNKLSAKIAILSISLMLMSPPAINGALPTIKEQLALTQAQTEILSTLPSLLVILFILLSSNIANRIGMKKSVSLGLMLIGLSGSLPLFTGCYAAIVISRLMLGAGLGLFNSLAVSFISLLYYGETRTVLLGFRNSVESFGQAALTVIAGLLLNLGWQYTFAVYFLAFPLILVVLIFVPETNAVYKAKKAFNSGKKLTDKIENPSLKQSHFAEIFFICLFAVLLIMNSTAILVRFPSLAMATASGSMNSSNFLAMMPLLGMVAGIFYGRIHQLLGTKLLYLSLALLVIANLLVFLSGTQFILLLMGLFLSGIPMAWIIPYVFNHLCKLIPEGNKLNLAISLFVVGCNLGGLLAPYAMQLIEDISRNQALSAPFPVFASLHGLIILGLLVKDFRQKKREA